MGGKNGLDRISAVSYTHLDVYKRQDIHPNRRNYCLIVMGLNTALRISDLRKLKWDNVYNFEHHAFRSHFLINEQKTSTVLFR